MAERYLSRLTIETMATEATFTVPSDEFLREQCSSSTRM